MDGGYLRPALSVIANTFVAWLQFFEMFPRMRRAFLWKVFFQRPRVIQLLKPRVINLLDALKPNYLKFRLIVSRIDHLQQKAEPFVLGSESTLGRHFCVTEKGYIGWVSPAAREGDDVAMFYGTRFLFALRREDGGFRLMGDCYLQSLMRGEAAKSTCRAEVIRIL